MTGLRAWGVWALLALTGLAGCVGGQSASVETTSASVSVSPGDVDLDTGIRGTVMSTELSPIPEAVVQVDDLPSVKTDNAGVFEVLGLTPGDHSLVVQALGYASVARKVTANQGEVAEVRITLERLEIQEPYIEVLVRDGYDICSYALFAFVGSFPSPCPLGTRINSHDLNLTEDWAYFVVQIVWQSSESFWVSINTKGAGCTTGAPCPGVEISRSPLRVDGAPEDAAVAKRYALDGKKTYAEGKQGLSISTLYAGLLREEINSTAPAVCVAFWGQFGVASRLGCPLGFGYSTGIRFKQYVSISHWERPLKPSEYSALPDA